MKFETWKKIEFINSPKIVGIPNWTNVKYLDTK